jgi:multidrug efflux pump subunit AcrB
LDEVAGIAKDEVDRGNAARVIVRTGNYNRQSDVSSGMVMIPLVPWGERTDSANTIMLRLRARTQDIPGVRVVSRAQGGIGGGGTPVSVV